MRFLAPPRAEVGGGAAPSFSVIVAAYQVADVIGDALDSIRQQTLPPLEVIVCDDGSSDDLQRALEPYRDEIVLLQKENGGEASAKNAAAAAASGDFVAILDADDVYLPGRLAALSELAQARPDLDILTTDAYLVVDGRRVRRNYDRGWRFEVADQRRAILQRNFVFGHAAVRRERLLEHGGFDEAILWTTDWELWLRLILAGRGPAASTSHSPCTGCARPASPPNGATSCSASSPRSRRRDRTHTSGTRSGLCSRTRWPPTGASSA